MGVKKVVLLVPMVSVGTRLSTLCVIDRARDAESRNQRHDAEHRAEEM